MSIISISITRSGEEVVAGIPRVVILETNVPATIFYTLDGSQPGLYSDIYVDPIVIPQGLNPVTLKVFATNGVVSSPIITEVYETNILNNTRLPHSATTAPAQSLIPPLYPYGTSPIQPEGNFLNPGDAGQTVDDPNLPQIPNGFDGAGNPDGYTNLPYTLENYKIIYSQTNSIGQYGKGIGNLPAKVTVQQPIPAPEESNYYSAKFDPRAFVIFQDVSEENPNDPPQINRQSFTLQSPTLMDGTYLFNSGPDADYNTGSFVRSHFNPKENTITYYYFDSRNNRWIISKAPYQNKSPNAGQLYNIFTPRNKSMGFVFAWRPFARRILF